MKRKKPHRYFFNKDGIKGHVSYPSKPSKETEAAVFEMVKLAYKNVKPNSKK